MSWVESGYISHPTTDNQYSINDSSFEVRDREIYNVSAMFDDTITIRNEPTSFDDINLEIREQPYSVTSTTSTISLLFGGFTDCMQPVKSVYSSMKGYFNPYKIDGKDIHLDTVRDLHAQGMEGNVYRTRFMGNNVAVKRLVLRKSYNPELIETLARLRPDNIVAFTGHTMEPPQYIMEFLPHGTLSHFISGGGEIPPKRLIRWSRNIVNGLEHLHRLNVIHCDLKSANLMLDDSRGEMELKIIDLESSITVPEGLDQVPVTQARGTTPYMSPEMIKQLPCTTMVDIWGFGIVLWEMVTLKPPYKGKEEQYVFYGIGMNKISLPIPDDIPDGIKLLLQMCWKQAPEARPGALYIKKHLEVLEGDLKLTSNESYRQSQMSWRQDCEYDEYEFDMEEIKQWCKDLECYRLLQMRYNALMTSYNNLYQEFKKLKKGQEPTLTRTRKKSSKKKKKSTSKTSLLFSNQNHVTLTRTVSAPLITEKNTLHRITDSVRLCQTPKANTLGARSSPENLPLSDESCCSFDRNNDYVSPIESDSSTSSRGSIGAHADIESGAETSEQDRIRLPIQRRHIAKLNQTTEEGDSAFDLSLSSQPEIRELADSDTDVQVSGDEFGDENLENYGVTCV